jgi:hypothetical protein
MARSMPRTTPTLNWKRWAVFVTALGVVLVTAVGLGIRRRHRRPAREASDLVAAPALPVDEERGRRPPAGPRPVPPAAPPQWAKHPYERRPLDWTSPGLCEDNGEAVRTSQRRAALLRGFRTNELKGVLLAHDEGVPDETLEAIRFALGRTRQFADYLLGWSPKEFPPPIYVYRDAAQLRSVACINGTISYYDGSIHLTGDPRYTAGTLTEETAHEYVHHVLTTMGVRRPIWLHEGLAMQIAGERWWRKPELGLVAWLEREHLPFDSLVDTIPHAVSDERRATAAYYQSYMMVGFIRQRRPVAYVRELLDDLAWGRLVPAEAFAVAADILPGSTLEGEWDRYVRAHRDF